MIHRRSLLKGMLAACMAPAIVKAGVLMPSTPVLVIPPQGITMWGEKTLTFTVPQSGLYRVSCSMIFDGVKSATNEFVYNGTHRIPHDFVNNPTCLLRLDSQDTIQFGASTVKRDIIQVEHIE